MNLALMVGNTKVGPIAYSTSKIPLQVTRKLEHSPKHSNVSWTQTIEAMCSLRVFLLATCSWIGPDFIDAHFSDDVDFSGLTFEGPTYFDGVEFSKVAIFKGTSFRGNVSFAEAKFGGVVDFGGASFIRSERIEESLDELWDSAIGATSFFGAQFESHADFRDSTFEVTSRFSNAHFKGPVSFRRVEFCEHSSAEFFRHDI